MLSTDKGRMPEADDGVSAAAAAADAGKTDSSTPSTALPSSPPSSALAGPTTVSDGSGGTSMENGQQVSSAALQDSSELNASVARAEAAVGVRVGVEKGVGKGGGSGTGGGSGCREKGGPGGSGSDGKEVR